MRAYLVKSSFRGKGPCSKEFLNCISNDPTVFIEGIDRRIVYSYKKIIFEVNFSRFFNFLKQKINAFLLFNESN